MRNHGDGHATLYAVNHGGTVPPDFVADRGGRETIEVFDVDMEPEKPALTWRGCIPLPAGLVANSVTSAPDGTILATVMLHPGASFADILAGHPTGAVYSWRPGAQGFRRVWGTELPANNGIAMSPDGKAFYVVSSLGINVFTNTNPAKLIHSTPLTGGNGDNIHWADGKVFVAGIKPASDARCADIMKSISGELGEACLPGYFVAAMEPGTFALTTVAEGPRIKGFSSAVTVGVPVGNTLWLGTSFGDRVAYRALP